MLKRHPWALTLVILAVGAEVRAAPDGDERFAVAAFATAKDPSGQKAAAAIGAILRERFAANRKLRLIEPGRVLSGDPKTREEESLDRARAAFADGRRAYDALNLDEAIARLGQAVTLYQESGPLLGDTRELAAALAHLGAALTLRGSTEEGVSTFVELLTIAPSYHPESFPPTVMTIFDRALETYGAAKRGGLEIYSTPPYAAVFLDGELRGVTPISLDELPAGTHYLRLEKDGFVVHGGPIEVSPEQQLTTQTKLRDVKRGPELRDLLSKSSREVVEDGMGSALRDLSRLLKCDTLVSISVAQSGRDVTLVGGVFDTGGASRLATERAVVSADSASFTRDVESYITRLEAAAARTDVDALDVPAGGKGFGLDTGAGAGARLQGSGGGDRAPQSGRVVRGRKTDGTPETTEVLGWVLIGTGIASIGVGAVLGISALNTQSDFEMTPQASPDLASIQRSGETKAIAADICIFGGSAAILGGLLTLILTDSDDSISGGLAQTRVGFLPLEGGGLVGLGGPF